jgi:hypothetical protein
MSRTSRHQRLSASGTLHCAKSYLCQKVTLRIVSGKVEAPRCDARLSLGQRPCMSDAIRPIRYSDTSAQVTESWHRGVIPSTNIEDGFTELSSRLPAPAPAGQHNDYR